MGTIIYIIGVVATVLAIVDVFKKSISTPCKIGVTIVLLLTSWLGLIVYWLYAKDRLESWCR